MTDQMLHTPDGVRDIYNGECKQKLLLQERLHDVLRQYGYRDIQTPTFEFFNIFGKEIGTTPSKDLYKFFDKDGSTLVLLRILLHLLQEVLQSTIPRMICR